MRALEPRVLLDAAGFETALEHVNDAVHSGLADDWFARRTDDQPAAGEPAVEIELADAGGPVLEYVFITADAGDVSAATAKMPPDARVVLLDPAHDGVEQMADALAGATDVRAIHIVSHGRPGALALGSAELTAASTQGRHADALSRIGAALGPEGDLLLYGCDFGAGAAGAHAIGLLADATGADVAASTDATGGIDHGGDWVLEAAHGSIEAQTLDAGNALGGTLDSRHIFDNVTEVATDGLSIDPDDFVVQTFVAEAKDQAGKTATGYIPDHMHLWLSYDAAGIAPDVKITVVDPMDGEPLATATVPGDWLGKNPNSFNVDFTLVAGAKNGSVLARGETYQLIVSVGAGPSPVKVGISAGDRVPGTLTKSDGNGFGDKDLGGRLGHEVFEGQIGPTANLAPVFIDPDTDRSFVVAEGETEVTNFFVMDPDGDGSPLTYVLSGPDADRFEIDGNRLRFAEAPDDETSDDRGPFHVRIVATDGSGGTALRDLTVSVADVDEAPTSQPLGITTPQGVAVPLPEERFGIDDQDDGDELAWFKLTAANLNGGRLVHSGNVAVQPDVELTAAEFATLVFEPGPDDDGSGTTWFDYRIATSRGTGAPLEIERDARFEIAITPNDVPKVKKSTIRIVGDEPYTFSADSLRVEDAEGDALWIVLTPDDLAGGTLWRDRGLATGSRITGTLRLPLADIASLSFVPAPGSSGSATLLFTASDSADAADLSRVSATRELTIEMRPTNEAPTAATLPDRTSDDADTVSLDLSPAFFDADDATLAYSATGLPSPLAIDPDTGIVSGRIAADASTGSPYTVRITATDAAGASAEIEFRWTVANPAPLAVDGALVMLADGTVEGDLRDFASDPDGDDIVFAPAGTANGGTLSLQPDGRFLFTPASGATGEMSFGYRVSDGEGGERSGAVRVTVLADEASYATAYDEALALGTSLMDGILAAEPAAVSLVGPLPDGGTLVALDPRTGAETVVLQGERLAIERFATLRFLPTGDNAEALETRFAYAVERRDGSSLGDPIEVGITIAAAPPPPAAVRQADVVLPNELAAASEEEADETEDEDDKSDEETNAEAAASGKPNLPERDAPFKPKPASAAPVAPPVAVQAPAVEADRTRSEPALAPEPAAPVTPIGIAAVQGVGGYTFSPMEPITLKREVARAGNDVREHDEMLSTTAAKVTFAFGSMLAVGSVSYLIQGGAIAGALLSALPAWRRYDPIEIVAGRKDVRGDDAPSSVERMREAVQSARARVERPDETPKDMP